MFTIKVTYRGQIRKHTFSDLNTFPSYDQICSQLYHVFSISQNFYLSKLLFSPDAAQPARILIGREVHTAYDYNKCIRQFRDRTWPHGLLRFNMYDETLTGTPPTATPVSRRSTFEQNHSEMPHIPGSAFFDTMPPLVEVPAPRDSWNVLSSALGRNPPQSAQRSRPTPQHRNSAPAFGACCSVAEAKSEVQAMLVNFQGDLNRVLEDNLGLPVTTSRIPSHDTSRNNSTGSLNSAPPPALCSVCTLNISASSNGPDSWYCCTNCHLVVCESCHDKSRPGFCLSTMSSHVMKQATTPLIESTLLASAVPIPRLPPPWLPRTQSDRDQQTSSTAAPAAASRSSSSADPVVHGGIICDVCDNTIEGIRHKCLDCPDYDLCTSCITSGSAAAHNPFHEFFEITEPGRVIVHTVFSGNGERELAQLGPRPSAPEHRETPAAAQTPTVHLATCDLCDSRILGDRYKCVKCPDFDTCSSCFSITNEQHPGHPFVRLSKKDDFIRVNAPPRQMHYANCDACSKTIMGTRFKCMHPHCPDYDLCEKCEALPIPVHPQSHPMLKMKTTDTIVPTVYRVGQTNLIRPTQSSVNVVEEKRVSPVVRVYTPMEEDRIPTPKAVPPLPAWMAAPSVFRDESPAPRVASPERPPLPPKPEMISHPSWASIPSFYAPSVNMDSMYTPTSRADNAHGYFANPFADMPAPSPVSEPLQHVEASVFETQTQERDISLPSVPNHIPNPWPTTNPAERRELLQLIADFAGPSTSAKLISSLSDAPSRRSSRVISEVPSPLLDLSVDSLPTVSSKQASSTKGAEEPARKDFLPTVPVTPEFFSSLFQRMEDAAEQAFTFEKDFVVDGPSSSFSSPETTEAIKKSDEIPVPEMKEADNAAPSLLSGFHDFSLSHLLERVEKLNAIKFDDIPSPLTAKPASEAESTFSQEALLKRPTEEAIEVEAPNAHRSTLADLINDLPSLVPPKEVVSPQAAPEVVVEEAHPAPVVPLSASFLDDVTVPDGQVFPPGAEFVKCWRLKNDSERDWPESTELVFVAGESLSTEKDVEAMTVELGKVVAGAQIDVWTGELKAPDASGRYVGYWRLRADGELFGNSLWIEINVAEADSHHSSDESMSASSVIIMPTVSSVQRSQYVPSSTARTPSVTASALSISEDNVSDAGSDISLISMPSSPSGSDDEDDVLWHDSRSYTTEELAAATAARNARSARPSPASAMDYVLLYDDNSSSSSEE